MPPRVLCDAAWDLQRYMASLMWLDGDEIVEASLLGPTDDKLRVPLTSEEETLLLGDEPETQEAPKTITSPLNAQKPLNPKNHLSSLMLQAHLLLCPWHQIPIVTSPGTPGEPSAGLDPSIHQTPIETAPTTGSMHTWKKKEELLSWWQEFRSLCHKSAEPICDTQV